MDAMLRHAPEGINEFYLGCMPMERTLVYDLENPHCILQGIAGMYH